MSYKIIKKQNRAKSATFETVDGTIETPCFMNVGTIGAIKGAVDTFDLLNIKTQVLLCNTYHLHVRTGDEIIKTVGGLKKFANWNRPILTDSGGFQVFSLTSTGRKITEEGVYFKSHIDGSKIFMGPEESMNIQSNLGSTIAMAFDECPPALSDYEYIKPSVERTTRWLERSINHIKYLNSLDETINKQQILFGINQGGIIDDVRIEHAKVISKYNLSGYAIGGLAVGETHEQMYHILDITVPYLPEDKPVYLMGVGTPENIIEAVDRGVDFFDCVYPSRNGRHGHVYTKYGKINLLNNKYIKDENPIEDGCMCPTCINHSRAYVRHLLKSKEMLGARLCTIHNLYYYNNLMSGIRDSIRNGNWSDYKNKLLSNLKFYNN